MMAASRLTGKKRRRQQAERLIQALYTESTMNMIKQMAMSDGVQFYGVFFLVDLVGQKSKEGGRN